MTTPPPIPAPEGEVARELRPGTSTFDRRCHQLASDLFHEWANLCEDFEPMDEDHVQALIGGVRNLLMREIRRTYEAALSAEKQRGLRAVEEARAEGRAFYRAELFAAILACLKENTVEETLDWIRSRGAFEIEKLPERFRDQSSRAAKEPS